MLSLTPDEIVAIKRNRSLAYLRTKHYYAALADTGFLDFSEEASEKAQFRAVEALYYFNYYEECCNVLEKLCDFFLANKEAIAALICA